MGSADPAMLAKLLESYISDPPQLAAGKQSSSSIFKVVKVVKMVVGGSHNCYVALVIFFAF